MNGVMKLRRAGRPGRAPDPTRAERPHTLSRVILRTFGWSFLFHRGGLVTGLILRRASGLVLVAILIVLEVSLSFDNAVVNAKVLERMSPFWHACSSPSACWSRCSVCAWHSRCLSSG